MQNNKRLDSIRLLETGYNAAEFNMALDEVLMQEMELISSRAQALDGARDERNLSVATNLRFSQKIPDTRVPIGGILDSAAAATPPLAVLRIYGWRPPAVSIGYFQSMEQEVQVDECRNRGISVVRRITGGGAVYHEAELTYSFITNVFSSDILQSYKLICEPVLKALRKLGFDSRFVPLNDIVIGDGVKVSGNAQTRRKNVILQHGTILLDVDVEKMFSLLNVPTEKMKDKIIDDVKKRVIGVRKPFEEVAMALKSSFSEVFDCGLVPDNITSEERVKVNSIIKKKYSLDSWNWKR